MTILPSDRVFSSGVEFFHCFFRSEWEPNNIDKYYARVTTVGRSTNDRTWKSLERFCKLIGKAEPFEVLNLDLKRLMGIKFAERDYHELIKPMINELKPLQTKQEVMLYIEELESKKSITSLEKSIVGIYWKAVDAFSPVPSLVSICLTQCNELKRIHQEDPVIKDTEQQNAPHKLPNQIAILVDRECLIS